MFQAALRLILKLFYKPLVTRKLKKICYWNYDDLQITVLPGVFHPKYFYSSLYLLKHLKTQDLQQKTVLEVGSGSGLLSVYCAKQTALVTAIDINPVAIENTILNAKNNQVKVNAYLSDLFAECKEEKYDILLINPPFFAADPKEASEYAWRCGKNFEYYHRLFLSYKNHIKENSQVFMVLSDIADLNTIESIAKTHGSLLNILHTKRTFGEKIYLYSVKRIS